MSLLEALALVLPGMAAKAAPIREEIAVDASPDADEDDERLAA